MSKVLQVVIYKSINDEEKLAAYAELAGPAMKAAGAKFLARGIPLAVKEEGQKTRTVVVEWESLEPQMLVIIVMDIKKHLKSLMGVLLENFVTLKWYKFT